ncbi:hypothetical protein DPMN_084710 [Dreissena polymorpha]|uniref:Uncharacterized protein n=1 Tax=Dreissena polymorpha TaxID=45954 RepID=A0A9D3YBG7_DREPO|nr:hypothetical protein DPMN_084710 [Dreissena polymorpha]
METPSFIRNSIKPLHWGCPWIWKRTSMFLYIPINGSTFVSHFEARYTSFERCQLGWQQLR